MNVSHLPGGTLARSVTAIQDRIAQARSEMVTGQVADPVVSLGAGRGRTLAIEAQADRLDRVRDSNVSVSGRLDATVANLAQARETNDELVETFVGVMAGALDRDFLRASATAALERLTQSMNATHGGGHLFAGATSDVAPIGDGSTAATALEARFQAQFGFASDDPAAASIAPDAATAFAAEAAAWLSGPGWPLVSDASASAVSARIAPGESVEIGFTVDERAFRNAYGAAFVAERLFESGLRDEAVGGVAEGLVERAGSASASFAQLEGRVGLVQARIARADERLADHATRLRDVAAETLGVDPFEAAQRFQSSVTQLETAYALTGRLAQLSLMRFL